MTSPTQLSHACPKCDGRGYNVSGAKLGGDWYHEKVSCPDCKGRGIVLTFEAQWAQAKREATKALSKWTLPSKRGRT